MICLNDVVDRGRREASGFGCLSRVSWSPCIFRHALPPTTSLRERACDRTFLPEQFTTMRWTTELNSLIGDRRDIPIARTNPGFTVATLGIKLPDAVEGESCDKSLRRKSQLSTVMSSGL